MEWVWGAASGRRRWRRWGNPPSASSGDGSSRRIPNRISSRGSPFILADWNTEAGRREGASVCVQKERADGPLTFAAINNVVTQLEKTTGSRKRLPWRREGLRSEEPLKRWRKQSIPCSREYLWVLLCTFSSYFIGRAVGFPHLLIP